MPASHINIQITIFTYFNKKYFKYLNNFMLHINFTIYLFTKKTVSREIIEPTFKVTKKLKS